MKILIAILFLIFIPATAPAADESHTGHEAHDSPAGRHAADTDPGQGEGVGKYAGHRQPETIKKFGQQPMHDNEVFAIFRGDRLEYRTDEGADTLLWDIQAWVGTDYNKLWFKSEGLRLIEQEKFHKAKDELFYSRNIATFWDLQVGIRHDFTPDPDRTFAALGVQGLAPYWFEVEATAYLSEDGDLSAAFEAEYDLFLSQRLILQPRFEINVALQEVEEHGLGRGINDIELGVRIRYEISRKVAPYIGLSWSRKIGETADLAKADGEDIDVISFLAGLKFWF